MSVNNTVTCSVVTVSMSPTPLLRHRKLQAALSHGAAASATPHGADRKGQTRLAERADGRGDQLSALGLAPTARARLGLAEVHAASTLERIRAKRDSH
jgi:hypothetical protein